MGIFVENLTFNKKLDLAWGHSICVRKAFVESIHPFLVYFNSYDVLKMDYTDHSGDLELIDMTRDIVERQVGIKYKHIFLTNGATGGLSIVLTSLKLLGNKEVVTNFAPFFRMYPDIIENCGLKHSQSNDFKLCEPSLVLLDNPANPTGRLYLGDPTVSNELLNPHKVIFDSVYYSKTYLPKIGAIVPKHDINVGSYSKMTGVNGIRIGYVALNDDILATAIESVVAATYCGLSHPQYTVTKYLVKNVDWDMFELKSKSNLDNNRSEWSKLEKYFGDHKVNDCGMFYWAPADKSCKDLLDRAGVTYFLGSKLYHNDDFVRINIGQDMEVVRDAVKAIIAEDKI